MCWKPSIRKQGQQEADAVLIPKYLRIFEQVLEDEHCLPNAPTVPISAERIQSRRRRPMRRKLKVPDPSPGASGNHLAHSQPCWRAKTMEFANAGAEIGKLFPTPQKWRFGVPCAGKRPPTMPQGTSRTSDEAPSTSVSRNRSCGSSLLSVFPPCSGRLFNRSHFGSGLRELESQEPRTWDSLTVNLRRFELPVPGRLQGQVGKIPAGSW
jgi:hypothetical protein